MRWIRSSGEKNGIAIWAILFFSDILRIGDGWKWLLRQNDTPGVIKARLITIGIEIANELNQNKSEH